MIEKLFEKNREILTYGTVTAVNRHIRTAVIQTAGGVRIRIRYPAEYDRIAVADNVVLAGRAVKNIISVFGEAGPESFISAI